MTKCLIFLSFIVLASLVVLNIYQNLINTPKKLFIDAINSLSSTHQHFNKLGSVDYSFISDDFSYDGKFDINLTSSLFNYLELNEEYHNILEILNAINNLEISYNLVKQDDELLFHIDSTLKNKNLGLSYYKDSNNHYIKINDYSEHYIKINDMIDILKNKFIYIDDKEYLIDFVLNSVANNLLDEYFNLTKEEIQINDEKVKVNKNRLTLDRKNITTILNKIILDIKKDEKAFNILIKFYPNFDNFNVSVLDNMENDIVTYFDTYTYNNDLIKCELEFDNINGFSNFDVNNINISFLKNDDILEIFIDKNKIANVNFYNKIDGYQADLYVNESKLLTINTSNTETTRLISLTSGIPLNNSFNLTLSEIIDQNILEDYDKLENKLFIDFNIFGFNLLKLEIKNMASIYDAENVDISIQKFINISDLSNQDFEKMKSIFLNFINEK